MSSQGDDFAVYATEGMNRSLGTFVIRGVGIDDVNGSDGLAATNRRVGRYHHGLLVSHDEPETKSPKRSCPGTVSAWKTLHMMPTGVSTSARNAST